jgi:hypothetical protein
MSDKVLGTFDSIESLHGILRARAEELGLSRETIDAISGLPAGYASKLFSPRPIKRLGSKSLPLISPTLAVKLIVAADEQATAALQARTGIRPRVANAVRTDVIRIEFSRRHFRKMGKRSRANMTAEQASALGRRGARARWRKARAA